MSPNPIITEEAIHQYMSASVSNVFDVMLNLETAAVGGLDSSVPSPQSPAIRLGDAPQIVGTIGFTGEAKGLVYLYLDLAFARHCAGQILGMTESELTVAGDEVVHDAIAEVTNMTAGGFKNCLCDCGYPCMLSLPSILRGNSFYVVPVSNAMRHTLRFNCSEHTLVADLFIKLGD